MHSEHSMDTGADLHKSISRPSGGKVAARSSRHPGFVRELFVVDAPGREIAEPRLERVGANQLPLILPLSYARSSFAPSHRMHEEGGEEEGAEGDGEDEGGEEGGGEAAVFCL